MARKILLADDSVTAQNMGRKILADAGYEVITVNNGSAALKKIAEQKPDLIILDVYMPGYSGLEVCQRLKDAQDTSRVPVLLTVGKLEPFKPEEAKRVRADGFIVKPFEASELLSALSKLEDKIVPRAEASKPGRFARVTASLDEGKFDRTTAPADDDSGWKNRISFPSKKKEKSAPEGDSAAISNAAASERKRAEKPSAIREDNARVDLGALAPEGLPKDVTPEEIAALAAAAAQVKGKIAESSEAPAAHARTESGEPTYSAAGLPPEVPAAAVPVVDQAFEQKFEPKLEEKSEEKSNSSGEKFSEAPAETAGLPAASHSDLMAAIAGLDPGARALPIIGSGNEFPSQHAADQIAPEPITQPVTMAIGAGDASVAETPRWTAVSVAVGKEEATISLEHEMQKAYAAFAAAVAGQASSAAVPANEYGSVGFAAATESPVPPPLTLPEPPISIPAAPVAETGQTWKALSSEAIRATVNELEMVAEQYPGEAVPKAPGGIEPAASETKTAAELGRETSQAVEAITKESPSAPAQDPQPEAEKLDTARHAETDSGPEVARGQEWKSLDQTSFDRTSFDRTSEESKKAEPTAAAAEPQAAGATVEKHQLPAPSFVEEARSEQMSASPVSADDASAASAPAEHEEMPKNSDAAATTAAAWANWRRVRESDDSRYMSEEPTRKETEAPLTPPDTAAMAVAAGAEKTPTTEESDSDPAAIASIVDSVLADLRPKIFEEISRKMGKKK